MTRFTLQDRGRTGLDEHLRAALDADEPADKNYHIRSAMQYRVIEADGEGPPVLPDGGTERVRPPCEAVAHMDPHPPTDDFGSEWDGPALERRVCPNCRLYFDVGAETDRAFCSNACERRHERGELVADGGGNDTDREQLEPCDYCYRSVPESDLIPVYTIINDIERKERVCPDCEEEARRDEKPIETDGGTSTDGNEPCSRDGCDSEARWWWWNGMGAFGPYCDDHAREELDDENRCPITRREDKLRQYRRTNRAVVIPAGIQPIKGTYPTIRTVGAFDTYLETDGEEPHQCTVSWCSELDGECSHAEEAELATDGGVCERVRERTLNPETHTAPDYKRLIYETDAAIHFTLKDDKEWWVAHGPENEPPGRLNGPWLFWTTYPSGGWELDFFTREFASHHLEELYYIDYDGDEAHSIHRARLVPMDDAPDFVQEVVGWNDRGGDTEGSP